MTGMAAGAAALTGVGFGWWGVAAIAVAVLVVAVAVREPRTWAGVAVVFVVAACGAWRAGAVSGGEPPAIPPFIATATVAGAPVRTGQSQYFVAAVSVPGQSDDTRVCVSTGPFPVVRLDDTVALNVSPVAAPDAPASRRAGLAMRGCVATAFAPTVAVVGAVDSLSRSIAEVRTRLNDTLRLAAPGDAGVLLAGLVTGDDDGFSPAREDAFRRTSTTHLTAVSGSNLALVAGIAATIGVATLGRQRLFWQAATIVAVSLYAVISGAQPPALRAAVVASAAVLAFRFGRRPDFPTLILLAAGGMVLVEPRQIDALGFRLSVAASLALAWVLPRLLADGRTWRGVDVVAGTIVAQLATLPLLLPVFGTVSLLSVPANALAAPLAAATMPVAALAGVVGLVSPPLAEVIAAPAGMLATLMLEVIDGFAAAPGYVSVGIPPLAAAVVLALATAGLLAVLGGARLPRGRRAIATGVLAANSRAPAGGKEDGQSSEDPEEKVEKALPAAALAVLAGEDPAHPLRADANHPVKQPPGEEDGHGLTDDRERRQPVLRNVLRHAPMQLPRDHRHEDADQDQRQDEHLSSLPHQRQILAAEEVEPFHA